MSTLEDWLDTVQDALDVAAVDRDLILDVAREVAHAVARPAAPLTTYLLGFAAGRAGTDPASVAAQIRALLPAVGE